MTRRAPAGNLPRELTSFVGRRAEIAAIRRLLTTSRLVTLTGVGGVGKSRLALRVATEVRRSFPDGVWLADLAALPGPGLLAQALADATGVPGGSAADPAEALTAHLADRELLLVADNCEHLLPACGILITELLRACPGVEIIATSREVLNVPGEYVFPVAPLAVPAWGEPVDPGRAGDYPGLALFAERAALARGEFSISAENIRAVARICRRLDGLPLAIELAAARLRAVSASELARRIDDRFRVLGGGLAGAEPRHRTLRAAVEWSFLLCGEAEQLLWIRASVFAGRFSLAAAEHVCADGGLPATAVLDAVSGLIAKSVFIVEDYGGELRYRMLNTVRAYGLDRLRSGSPAGPGPEKAERGLAADPGETELRLRHASYYCELAERFAADWFGPREAEWSALLRLELPNLRAALSYSLGTRGRPGEAVRIAGGLQFFWSGFGELREGRMWLERALELGTRDRRERARAETALGRILIAQGHHAAAVPPLRAAVPAARADGDPDLLADALAMLGLALATAEPAEAMQLLDEAMERAAGARARAGALLCRGVAALHAGNPRLARELIARCAAICTAAGDRLLLGTAYGSTVLEALSSGDVERAGACAREGVLNYQELHDTVGLAMALESLAWTATAARDYRRAARLLGACDRESAEVGGNPLRSARFAEEHGDCVATVTRRLGPETFGAERRRGAALSTAALVRFALAPDHAPTAGRPRRSRAGPPGGGPLTRREQQVAGLVAQGLSNRQIAAKLVISTRTAEGHVENILIKLGFASRAQVAVWHAERCG